MTGLGWPSDPGSATENGVWVWTLLDDPGCIGCGVCADVCTFAAIEMTRWMGYPTAVADACTGCQDCVLECPVDTISVTAAE